LPVKKEAKLSASEVPGEVVGSGEEDLRCRSLLTVCQRRLGLLLHTSHTYNGPLPGLPRWAGTRKVKPIWILLKQETVSGSGISWAICKSAPSSRQITTTAPHHHSVFYSPDAIPDAQPTASKHWRLLLDLQNLYLGFQWWSHISYSYRNFKVICHLWCHKISGRQHVYCVSCSLQKQTSTLFNYCLCEVWEFELRWIESADSITKGTWILFKCCEIYVSSKLLNILNI